MNIFKRIICLFKGHKYGPIRVAHYREKNDFILYDEIQSCSRCEKIIVLGQFEKRTK